MTFIVDGPDAVSDADVGGKARALAVAARAGLAVPAWFVVRGTGEQSPCAGGVWQLDDGFYMQLAEALRNISPAGELVAVRSSAVAEDGVHHSFAGQFETFLNVAPRDVLARIEAVWRSATSARILSYRSARALPAHAGCPSVIVQRMVRARVAGVAFGADPISGRRGIAVVSAVRGFGSALVSGEADADTWHVDRHGAIVERHIADKRRMHAIDTTTSEGVVTVAVPEGQAEQPSLGDGEVRAIAELARRAGRIFGRPQDIEWAYEGDQLWLLQSRPITSLVGLADPDGAANVWDNSNIVESYSGVTSPLTFSFASEIYEHVYRQFCRLMHVPESAVADHDDAFRNMLGLIRGRLYYNLRNWYRVLSLLPGYALNRGFMEQMMGVREAMPADVADEIAASCGRARSRPRDVAQIVRTFAGLITAHITIERRIFAFQDRLDAALAPPDVPLDDMRADELVRYYRMLRGRLLLSWDAPLVNDFFAMIFYGLLRRVTGRWIDDKDGSLQNDLLGGDGGMVSAEPATRIQHLARIARNHPSLIGMLRAGTVDEIRRAGTEVPEFGTAIDAYLEKFGDRTVNELKLESATLHDDPLPLFRTVGAVAARSDPAAADGLAASAGIARRLSARRRVADALRWRPLKRLAFTWILSNARARVRDRENLRLERTRLFGRVRRVFVEIGKRLHTIGALDDPRDVFLLQVDEVLAFVEGRAVTTDLRALVAVRRAEHSACDRLPVPASRFQTRGVVYQGHDFQTVSAKETQEGEERRGIGCSPGMIRGVVRVVTDPRLVDRDQPSILVAEHTDPGWIVAFPSALAVIVERGSLLSHAAIVARELGIPAVVAVPGVTQWLQDGDRVELDGGTGVVRRVARSAESEAVRAR